MFFIALLERRSFHVHGNLVAGPRRSLKGTLTSPETAPRDVVIIIPGSGPTDRDGNGPGGLRAATYRLIAEGLLNEGVASIRIDKRGMYGSSAAVPDANAVTIRDYADDVRGWVTTVREQTGARCVWLLGHSEGGIAALVAAQNEEGICGAILLAVPGRPLSAILRDQILAAPSLKAVRQEALTVLETLTSGQRVPADQIDHALLPIFRPEVQGLLASELRLDPSQLVASVKRPVLILQGGKDLEVSVADARLLKRSNPWATLVLINNANHFFKDVEKSSDYNEDMRIDSDSMAPLDPAVIEAIARFIKMNGSSK
ncbi:hypothetical protein ADM96_30800 [Burkholderia sp. ST111]|nr:hypothetical protein ADM96_30800 [Burkholderia sp. ST111]